jgi:polyphosphate glucokinase
MEVLGIDIGGSGIKGAPVDLDTGAFVKERLRIPTPDPSVPDEVAKVVSEITANFAWTGPVGITFPGVVIDGVTHTAANVDSAWIGLPARDLLAKATALPVTLLNDADAAGVAEMTFGAGRGKPGVVLTLTFGTGIGSALFVDGVLVPNTEFGHVKLHHKDAETRASDHAREAEDLGWHKWAERVEDYLQHMEALLSPSLIIIGGGVSKKADKFLPLLHDIRCPVVAAELHNDAGIVGAAMSAAKA